MQEATDMRWKLAAIHAKQDHQIYYDLALNISVAVVSVALISAASAAMVASLTFGAVPILVPSLIIATALITLKWAAFGMYNNIKLETYKKDLPADLFESKAKLEMESKGVVEENQTMAINTM
jgi:energy-converting hydrogenase Eha subunit E